MKRGLIILLVAVVYILAAASVWGQEYIDVVYLKNGSMVKGIIIEQIPGVSIKIETADGSVFVFKVEDVEKLTKERKAGEAPAEKKVEAKESETTDEGARAQLMSMITSRSFLQPSGNMQMNNLAKKLSQNDRFMLFTTNKKQNAAVHLVLNMVIPSIGSWVQGDFVGALVQDLFWVTGFIMMGVGWETEYYYVGTVATASWQVPTAVFYTGAGFITVAWITGLITPFVFESDWNGKLATALGVYMTYFEPEFEQKPVATNSLHKIGKVEQLNRHMPRVNLITVHY